MPCVDLVCRGDAPATLPRREMGSVGQTFSSLDGDVTAQEGAFLNHDYREEQR